MATHDYVIDNSTGANVRADINNVLQAILTNNSSSSAPSTTAAYMWWADTTNGVLKIRNSTNNAWVELLQLDGTLTLEDGSAANPGLAFRDDLDTGIFSGGANQFQITTGGGQRLKLDSTEIVFNDDGANTDFRIEGDTDTTLFFADASADKISIGHNAPVAKLDIRGSANAGFQALRLVNSQHDTNQKGAAQIKFGITMSGGERNARIEAEEDSTNSNGVGLNFYTNTAASADGETEKMRLHSSGRLLVGTTTPSHFTDRILTVASSGGAGIEMRAGTSSISQLSFSDGTGNDNSGYRGFISYAHNTDTLNIGSAGLNRMVIDSSGNIGLGETSPASKVHISGSELRLQNGSVPFIRLKSTNAQSSDHFDYGRLLNDVAGNVTGLLDWKRQAAVDDSYFTVFNKQSGAVIQERLRITSAGALCVHAGQQTSPNTMNFNSRSLPKFFENTAGQDSNLTALDMHFETVIRVTGSTDHTLFTFQGGGNCGVFVEITAYYSSAITGFQGRQRFAYRAHRTSNNNFTINVSSVYDGQGFETASYFNPSFTSSSSGINQVLGIRVQSQNMGAYVRILYHAKLVTNDSIGSITVNR